MKIASKLHFLPLLICLLLVGCIGGDRPADGTTPPPGTGQPPPTNPPPTNPPPTNPPPTNPPPATNSPPVISGSPPPTATVGQPWTFQPSISDPDGDPLTVSVQNRPAWISLEPSTGYMAGTPDAEDVRTWSGIRVQVSDGQATASLAWFSITVSPQEAHTGTATLSWSPPTERADGSPIGELAGYRVLYGQTSQEWDTVVPLNNPGLTRYVIEGLGPGTWYFAVKAVTTDGLMSAPSQEVSKTI